MYLLLDTLEDPRPSTSLEEHTSGLECERMLIDMFGIATPAKDRVLQDTPLTVSYSRCQLVNVHGNISRWILLQDYPGQKDVMQFG